MSTNVYAVIKKIYDDQDFDQISKLAQEHNEKGLIKYIDDLQIKSKNYTIHIGKRSGGWRFLFNHNNWKYYDYSRESIDRFLRSCYQLKNEYDEILTVDQFWKEYVDDYADGFTGEDYAYYELNRAKNKNNDIYPHEFVPDLIIAQRMFNDAQNNNWYECKYYKMPGTSCSIEIPNYLKYRFSNSTDFC